MRPKIMIGIILIALGIAAFAYQGITYTTREKVVDIGSIQVTAEKTKTLALPPIVGVIALVGGIVLLVMGSRKGG
jgi:membrane-bound ClpP family serine protease